MLLQARRFPGEINTERFVLERWLPAVLAELEAANKNCFVDLGHHTILLESFHLVLARALLSPNSLGVVRILRPLPEVRLSFIESRRRGPCAKPCSLCLCAKEHIFCSRPRRHGALQGHFREPPHWRQNLHHLKQQQLQEQEQPQQEEQRRRRMQSNSSSSRSSSEEAELVRIGRKWWDKQDVGKQFEVMIKEVQCRFDHFIAEIGNGEVVVGHEDDGNNEASSDGRRVEVFGKKRVRVLTVAWSTNGASGNFRAAAVAVSDFLGLARGSVPPRHLPHLKQHVHHHRVWNQNANAAHHLGAGVSGGDLDRRRPQLPDVLR